MTNTVQTNKWAVLGVILIGIFMAMLDSSIVNIALPTMVDALHTDFATAQWIPLSYMLTVTCLMLLAGRSADMLGKRTPYALGFAIFTLASLLCALSTGIVSLIAARVLQGVGAALIMALGPAVLVETFPPAERGKALGITGSVVSLGIIVGPTLGGIMLAHWSWNMIFYVNLPFGVVGTLLALRLVSKAAPRARERFDVLGGLTLTVALLSTLLALTAGQKPNFDPNLAVGLFALGAAAFVAFLSIELRTAQPLIDLRMFSNRVFSANLLASFINFITVAGTVLLMPFYLQNVLKLPPQTAGLVLSVMPIALGVVAPLAGTLSDKYGVTLITSIGLVLVAVGFALLDSLTTTTSITGYIVRFLPIGVGLGMFQSPNNSAIMGAAPRERLGVASGLLAVARTLGQTSGIAVLGAFWYARVNSYAAGQLTAAVNEASPEAQVYALHDTALLLTLLTFLSLAIIVGTAWRSKRRSAAPAAVVVKT